MCVAQFCDRYATTCGAVTAWSDCKTDFAKITAGSGNGQADSQACRLFHLGLAENGADDAKIHCPHASKDGGNMCVAQFCDRYETTCGSVTAWSDCKTDFAKITAGSGNGNADTQACRQFHLGLAEKGADEAKIHCPHASKDGGETCVAPTTVLKSQSVTFTTHVSLIATA